MSDVFKPLIGVLLLVSKSQQSCQFVDDRQPLYAKNLAVVVEFLLKFPSAGHFQFCFVDRIKLYASGKSQTQNQKLSLPFAVCR